MSTLSLKLWLYEAFWCALALLLESIARFKPELQKQVEGRRQLDLNQGGFEARDAAERCAIFFASSAGEYEQAKPLAQRLGAQGYFVVFIFASVSGIRFAASQGEATPCIKAPWDSPRLWLKIFQRLRPHCFFIVRYELWPGFLAVAQQFGRIYLVDAVASRTLESKPLARWVWRKMLGAISEIFVVGETDRTFFLKDLAVDPKKIHTVGDTKYDRVFERREERQNQARSLREKLASFIDGSTVLIVGSAWEADLRCLLSAYRSLRQEGRKLKLIVAPHDISKANADKMQAMLEGLGLKSCRVSQRDLELAKSDDDALLVDRLGILPELYALSHVAWVGGGMHYRVHNVLEPACRGIYICFGPRYQTSQEALWLVKQGLAQVIHESNDFLSWFRELNWDNQPPHQALWLAVGTQRGASERILRVIEERF